MLFSRQSVPISDTELITDLNDYPSGALEFYPVLMGFVLPNL